MADHFLNAQQQHLHVRASSVMWCGLATKTVHNDVPTTVDAVGPRYM